MKKKLWGALILAGTLAAGIGIKMLKANSVIFRDIANESALSYSKAYTVDTASAGVDRISAQVNIATTPITAITFTDGSQSTATITISSFPFLVESRSSGTITIASNTALNGSYAVNTVSIASNAVLGGAFAMNWISVSSNVQLFGATITFVRSIAINVGTNTYADDPFTALSSSTFILQSSVTWSIGTTTQATTINLANALNSIQGISASTVGVSSIQVTSVRIGSAYNYYTLASNTVAVVVAQSSFTAGYDPVTLTIFDPVMVTSYTFSANSTFQEGASSQASAINLTNALNAMGDSNITASTADVQGSSVTLIFDKVGAFANAFMVTSSSQAALQVGGQFFKGGADRVFFSINGKVFTSSVDFFTDVLASGTAINIASAIINTPGLSASTGNTVNNPTAVLPIVITSAATSIINFTAISTGAAYVYTMISSSQTAIGLSGISTALSGPSSSTIGGGRDVSFITIDGITLRQGINWFAVRSNTATAASISDAIMRSSLTAVIQSTFAVLGSSGIVTSTSIICGISQNFGMFSSSGAVMVLSGPVGLSSPTSLGYSTSSMQGGTDPGFSTGSINGSVFTLPNNLFGVGTAVRFSTPTGFNIAPLFNGTTYFLIRMTSSTFQLAAASTGAVVGSSITITSISTQPVAHTYTLTPIQPLGLIKGWWQVSNDSNKWFDLNVATMSLGNGGVYVPTTTIVDFGQTNYRYQRFNVILGTPGETYNMNVVVHGKN